MNELAGIPISELRLLVETVVFTLLFVAALVAFGFAVYTQSNLSDRRKRRHLKRLRERADAKDENPLLLTIYGTVIPNNIQFDKKITP